MWWRRQPSDPAPTPQEALHERLSAYLDDEVTGAERAEIEALLASDADARAQLADLQLLTSALASLETVRAPRSFAIPAPASAGAPSALRGPQRGTAGGGVTAVLARRMEWAMRASAGAAALLFVVALTYNPSGLTNTAADSGAFAQQEAATTLMAPSASDGAEQGGSGEPEFADGGTGEGAGSATDGGVPPEEATADGGEMNTMMVPGASSEPADGDSASATNDGAPESADGGADDGARRGYEPVDDAAQLGGPEAGTVRADSSSDGVGGVAPALGTLAILLAALSVMVARRDEQGSVDRR